jgi:hypothetical protein
MLLLLATEHVHLPFHLHLLVIADGTLMQIPAIDRGVQEEEDVINHQQVQNNVDVVLHPMLLHLHHNMDVQITHVYKVLVHIQVILHVTEVAE